MCLCISVYICVVCLNIKNRKGTLCKSQGRAAISKIRHKPLMRFWHLKMVHLINCFPKTNKKNVHWSELKGSKTGFFSLSQVIASWCLLNIHGNTCSKEVLNKYYYLSPSCFFFFFLKAGRKEEKNREREEREKEGEKLRKKGRKPSLKILPAKTWKKSVSLNSDDICGHFRQFPTVHPVSKYHSIGCSLKIRPYSQFTI